MTSVSLPITETTGYEQMVHDEFSEKFGYELLDK